MTIFLSLIRYASCGETTYFKFRAILEKLADPQLLERA